MADEQKLTSRRPYLIRALYDWVLDNDLTPHLLVAADAPGVDVPRHEFLSRPRFALDKYGRVCRRDLLDYFA